MDPDALGEVLSAYNGALVEVFKVALAMACMSILGAAAMEWRNIKPKKKAGEGEGSGNGGEKVEGGDAGSGDMGKEKV